MVNALAGTVSVCTSPTAQNGHADGYDCPWTQNRTAGRPEGRPAASMRHGSFPAPMLDESTARHSPVDPRLEGWGPKTPWIPVPIHSLTAILAVPDVTLVSTVIRHTYLLYTRAFASERRHTSGERGETGLLVGDPLPRDGERTTPGHAYVRARVIWNVVYGMYRVSNVLMGTDLLPYMPTMYTRIDLGLYTRA
jgi:hypothetical protein